LLPEIELDPLTLSAPGFLLHILRCINCGHGEDPCRTGRQAVSSGWSRAGCSLASVPTSPSSVRLAPWPEPELAGRPRHILIDEGIPVISARATSVEVHGDTRVVHTNRETASEDDAIMVATDRQARIDARPDG